MSLPFEPQLSLIINSKSVDSTIDGNVCLSVVVKNLDILN